MPPKLKKPKKPKPKKPIRKRIRGGPPRRPPNTATPRAKYGRGQCTIYCEIVGPLAVQRGRKYRYTLNVWPEMFDCEGGCVPGGQTQWTLGGGAPVAINTNGSVFEFTVNTNAPVGANFTLSAQPWGWGCQIKSLSGQLIGKACLMHQDLATLTVVA